MNILDYWKPHKLEECGIQQVSEARNLLETYGADLSPSKRVVAEDLLARCVDPFPYWNCTLICYIYSAEELELFLKRKRLLARFKLARQYHREAGEVLHKIEVSCMITQRSRREQGLILFTLQEHVGSLARTWTRASTDQSDS